jgi:hypothetical protein
MVVVLAVAVPGISGAEAAPRAEQDPAAAVQGISAAVREIRGMGEVVLEEPATVSTVPSPA